MLRIGHSEDTFHVFVAKVAAPLHTPILILLIHHVELLIDLPVQFTVKLGLSRPERLQIFNRLNTLIHHIHHITLVPLFLPISHQITSVLDMLAVMLRLIFLHQFLLNFTKSRPHELKFIVVYRKSVLISL